MWKKTVNYQQAVWRCCALLATAVLVAGCASTLSARVTSYQQWPADASGASYRIVPAPTQVNNLEFQAVSEMIRSSIGPTGLVEARAGVSPRFDVHIEYDSAMSRAWTQRYHDPYVRDGWGFGPAFGHYGGYGGWGGGVFMSSGTSSVPVDVYKNTLTVIIRDNQNNDAEVYRSSAVNMSSSDNLQEVMPYLAQAVFDGFPGNNGQVREVEYDRGR